MSNPIRILIVDDHEFVRSCLRSMVANRSGWVVCAEARDGLEAVERAREVRPNVVLMDISMPRMSGIEATKIIGRDLPETRVVIVTQNDPAISSALAAQARAAGCVSKSSLSRDLLPTIDRVIAERRMPNVSQNGFDGAGQPTPDPLPLLRQQADRAAALLAAIVESSDDAIVSKNLDGVIITWNKAAEQMFGYTAEEAQGQNITLIIPPDRREEETRILESLRRGERVDHFETVRMRKDGTTLDISLTISPIRDSANRIVGASKVARDITEKRASERALRQSREQLRALADNLEAQVRARTRELERQNAEILQQSEQIRQLSRHLLQVQSEERRRIARELHDSAGQSLAALGMNLARLLEEAKQNASHLLGQIEETAGLAQRLHQEIRTTSYLLHPPLLDESGLAAALNWYVQGLAERNGIDITLDIPEDFGRLPSDLELAVFRLVQECLTNVHRHSGSKTAAISIHRSGETISVRVTDQGKGISAERLAEIQSQGGGVGIRGMRERILQFHGDFKIESGGQGTTLAVELPLDVDRKITSPKGTASIAYS